MNSDCSTWTASSLRASTSGIAAPATSTLRNTLMTIGGALLVVLGLIGLVLPAPGLALIVIGLSMLSTRFALARRWLESVQAGVTKLRALRR